MCNFDPQTAQVFPVPFPSDLWSQWICVKMIKVISKEKEKEEEITLFIPFLILLLFIEPYTLLWNQDVIQYPFFLFLLSVPIKSSCQSPLCLFNLFFTRVMNNDTIWKYSKYTTLMSKESILSPLLHLPIANAFVTLRTHAIFCDFDSSRPVIHELFFSLRIKKDTN